MEQAAIHFDTKGKFKAYIVYSSEIELASAVLSAYVLGAKDVLQEVGQYLMIRKIILEAFNKADPLPWPPNCKLS